MDLSLRGKIRVTGEDRARLLHALSTNSISDLAAGDGVYAFFLSDKGRILADAYIYNFADSLFVDTEPETGAKLLEHLDRYLIADDAELHDETTQWAEIGIEGPESHEKAMGLGISVPPRKAGIVEWGAGFVTHVASTGPDGIRIFAPADQKQELIRRLEAMEVPQVSEEEARIVRIENGVPRYGEEMSERYLAQETQQHHAIHMNKGCYLGQEIVERVRSRGQVHRLLAPVRIHGTTAPASGTKLTAGANPAGEIASAVYSPAFDEVVALAYVRSETLHARPEMQVAGVEPPATANLI